MKTTFRPTPEQQAGMTRIAKALGKHVKNSDVMAWAVTGLISYFDAHGGKQLLMPPDFSQTFTVAKILPGLPSQSQSSGAAARSKSRK